MYSLQLRNVGSQRRDFAVASLFLHQLLKVINLSSELRFGCSWYRWKAPEVYNLDMARKNTLEMIIKT